MSLNKTALRTRRIHRTSLTRGPNERIRKLTRAEKSEQTRQAIFDAAAEIVGEYGYVEASVSRIMERAGLGHGTFYAYFQSRDELFDQLLPIKGAEVLKFLNARVKGASNIVDVEIRGFDGFLDYTRQKPWFFRLLHEAPVAAPEAYRKHIDNILVHYRRALKRSWDKGELPQYDENELDTLAYLLISARDYVVSQQVARSENIDAARSGAVQTYRKFITHGMMADSAARSDKPS